MAQQEAVIIIGAGPAGLATAAALRHRGIDPLLVEAGDGPATSWKSHYDRLHLNSVKWLSALPHRAMPRDYPRYPSRDQFVAYLADYARHFALRIATRSRVTGLHRTAGGWRIAAGNGVRGASRVVVATGLNRIPRIPALPGDFAGAVLHSSAYRNGAPFRGRRVLVAGAGNSGAEIALDLHEHGARPTVVARSPLHVTPLDMFGVLPAQLTSTVLNTLPLPVADAVAGAALRLVVGDLSAYGIRRPAKGPLRTLVEDFRPPTFDTGFLRQVRAGGIAVVAGITAVDGRQVCFADGAAGEFDALILATGFTPGLEEIIGEQPDAYLTARGWPPACGRDLGDGLYFVGFTESPRGNLNAIRRQALAAARGIAADLARQGIVKPGAAGDFR